MFLGEAEYDQVFGRRTLSGRIEDDRHTSGACKFAAESAFRNEERDGRREEDEREIANNNHTDKKSGARRGRKLKNGGKESMSAGEILDSYRPSHHIHTRPDFEIH